MNPEPKYGDVDSADSGPVRLLQEGLKETGHYKGQVDGKFFGETLKAVNDFRAEEGLDPLPAPEIIKAPAAGPAPFPAPAVQSVVAVNTQDLNLAKPEKVNLDIKGDPTKKGPAFPAITDAQRRALFGQFEYRPYPASIPGQSITVLRDTKTGRPWSQDNLVTVYCPQLDGMPLYNEHSQEKCSGRITLHKAIAQQFLAAMQAVEDAKLLKLILSYAGAYNPRYSRQSKTHLSNHAYATAVDFNANYNGQGVTPPAVGEKGSLRLLVPIFEAHGFFWGGYWEGSSIDGMHFEANRVLGLVPELKKA